MPKPIRFLALDRQQQELDAELKAVVTRVLDSGVYLLGEELTRFEAEWASFCDVRAAAGVANGTEALTLALLASGAVRPGYNDEVITTPLTAAYTALAIRNAGGVPVFADIDPVRLTLDPAAIRQVLTPRTRAIVPVHLYGQMAAMPDINSIAQRHNLLVIEDAAQAHGATLDGQPAGSFGDAATFSFYPTKNLGAWGDGGTVVSSDTALIERVKLLRQGGHWPALQGELAGRNSRLDELQAALLRVKLAHLPRWVARRRTLASQYVEALRDTSLGLPMLSNGHAVHLFVVQHPERDRWCAALAAAGIETLIHYPFLLHQQPLFARPQQPALPVAEAVVNRIFSLPLYPQLTDAEVQDVITALLAIDVSQERQ